MSILTKNQKIKKLGSYTDGGVRYYVQAIIRHDDECGNGHNTFSITGNIYSKHGDKKETPLILEEGQQVYWEGGGCCHDDIVKAIPKLEPYIKWHLCSTDGPMHYIANTLYNAGDRDCWGLREGEKRQIKNRKTGELAWILEPEKRLPKQIDSLECPTETTIMRYVPWCNIGEGKERDLDAARSSAIWPEATDEQLMLEPDELKKLLLERHPKLMQEFREAVESLGLIY
jgi:hypothetical protein